jgi:hypothetical protein
MKFTAFLKSWLKKQLGLWPQKLPVGISEFDAFAKKIFAIYEIPDLPSYRNAIATMIMHLPPTVDKMPLVYFGRSIKKAQSNQIAYEIIQQIKEAEKAAKAIEASEPVNA